MYGPEKEKRLQLEEQNRSRSLQQWNVHPYPMMGSHQASAAPSLSIPAEPGSGTSIKRERFPSTTQKVHSHASRFPALTSPFTQAGIAPLEFQSYDPLLLVHPANFNSEGLGTTGNCLQSASYKRTFGAAEETSHGDTFLIHQIQEFVSRLCPYLSGERISRNIEELQIENMEQWRLARNSFSIGPGDGMSLYLT